VVGVRKRPVQSIFVQPGRTEPPPGVVSVKGEELAAAMLDQVVRGFEMEPINNDDLVRIGAKVLAERTG
jgi:hypothetical protein